MSDEPLLNELNVSLLEEKWGRYWEEKGVYHWDAEAARSDSFVIDTPPPTVSGYLHLGHIFSYSQTDIIARYRRMSGKNVYYPIGYDDNGLPTERLVEKRRNVRAADMPREDFIRLCEEVSAEAETEFRGLFHRVALSVDWRQEYQTVSPLSRKMSQMSLLDLYGKGHLYQAYQPTLWDPVDRTAIAQAEIEDKEQNGTMYHLPFTMENGETVTIGTTRPELLLACVAVMYHPEDPRAAEFAGRTVISPLYGAIVPLVPDQKVDREKGSGVVMCCTFGDQTDIEWWRTYQLPLRNIVNLDGTLGNIDGLGEADWPVTDKSAAKAAAAPVVGMHIRKARAKVIEALKAAGLVLREEAIVHMIPCAERSGSPLEIIPTRQWVIRLLDKKEQLLAKGREIKWYPAFMRQRYEDWVINLKWDWCVSRQRYFGVPLPFWYSKRPGEEGRIILPDLSQLPVNPLVTPPIGYSMDEVVPERDVMDTWATSSLTPQINARAITKEFALEPERAAKLFPADIRPQAHEIIRTWMFYTMVKALLHADTVPFLNATISGWCLAPDSSKMSKSKGNAITPIGLLDKHGADAIRYWAGSARLGQDTVYSEDVVKVGKRLSTKLWNASKLVAPHVAEIGRDNLDAAALVAGGAVVAPMDQWLLSRLATTIESVTAAFEAFNYSAALSALEEFFWKSYCDNFLELCKGRLYGDIGSASEQKSAKATLFIAHRAILQMLAPVMPYLCEEIFSVLYPKDHQMLGSVHSRGNWPVRADLGSAYSADAGDLVVDLISAVRRLKSNNNASMRAVIPELQIHAPAGLKIDRERLVPDDFMQTMRCEKIKWVTERADDEVWSASDSGQFMVRGEVVIAVSQKVAVQH